MKTAKEYYENYTLPEKGWVHGRHDKLPLTNNAITMWTKSWDVAKQYSKKGLMWMAIPTNDTIIVDLTDPEVIDTIIKDLYHDYATNLSFSPDLKAILDSTNVEDIRDTLNPINLLDSAEMWDNLDFISWYYEKYLPDDTIILTHDGALILDMTSDTITFEEVK